MCNMTSLPKSGKSYTPAEIISVCKYFGWRNLVERIAAKHRDFGLHDFVGEYHCKELFRPLMVYQIECWVGGSVDEQYIAKLHLAVAVCRILGHETAEVYRCAGAQSLAGGMGGKDVFL